MTAKDESIFVGNTNLAYLSSMTGDPQKTVVELMRLNSKPPRGSVHQQLQKYRKLTEELLEHYFKLSDVNTHLIAENLFLQGGKPMGHRQRWTDIEDEALIEKACEDDANMLNLAVNFNRTPAAISSRLTYLVGVKRISRHVMGHLTGYLDGEPVEGYVVGEVEQ